MDASAAAVNTVYGEKANAVDLSIGVFAILTSVTRKKIVKNSLPFHKFRYNPKNVDIIKRITELYCLFIAADSINDAISFIRRIVLFCDPKISSPQIWFLLDLSS